MKPQWNVKAAATATSLKLNDELILASKSVTKLQASPGLMDTVFSAETNLFQ